MSISKPRATCKTRILADDSGIQITASEYQIIMAFSTLQPRRNQFGETIESTQDWEQTEYANIPNIVGRAIHNLTDKIKRSEQLKVQCTMIGEILFSTENTGKENAINDVFEYIKNKRT